MVHITYRNSNDNNGYTYNLLTEMKNLPKLKNIVVLGKFEDDGIRQFIVDEKTQHVILAAMKGINGGIIKVGEDAIEGITWKSNIDLNLK